MEARLKHVFDSIGKKYDEEAIAAIARAGAGSVRDMLSVADTCVSYTSGKLTYAHVTAVLGTADFSAVAKLCGAILRGDSGAAFEQAEGFLAAGKSVGMLLGDVLNFLNACAVAKTCRDGKAILALPDDMYKEVAEIAKAIDGHRLLRVTEIFAGVETDLKYSTSPRILFETAVLKASMPQADYDIEALIARIADLENKLASGMFVQNGGGMAATNAIPVPIKTETKPAKIEPAPAAEEEEEYIPMDYDAPPDEGDFGGNAYFDERIAPVKKQSVPAAKPAPAPAFTPAPTPAPAPVAAKPAAVSGDARTVFGTFLRSVRKTAKNGVLITICMDLDGVFEDGLFVLYTQSETAYRSLTREDHYALIAQAFAAIGMAEGSFEIRLRGKKSDTFNKAVEEVKATFNGVKVDVR